MAEAAAMSDLSKYHFHDLIEKYAVKFGLDPDYVYKKCNFETVTIFLEKWIREMEKADIYNELERLMHVKPNQA